MGLVGLGRFFWQISWVGFNDTVMGWFQRLRAFIFQQEI